MSFAVRLNCWILGSQSQSIFQVDVKRSDAIVILGQAVKAKNPTLYRDIEPHLLDLWKISVPECDFDAKLGSISSPDAVGGAVRLWPLDRVGEHFTVPTAEHIHIIVLPPPAQAEPSTKNVTSTTHV